MSNEYGQGANRERQGQPVTSVGAAIDLLMERFTVDAYGVYASQDDDMEPGAMVDGFPQVTRRAGKALNSQHQRSGEGLKVLEPAIYAELGIFEKEAWRLVRRELARLKDLELGQCIKCHERNDQPHRRYCSGCEVT